MPATRSDIAGRRADEIYRRGLAAWHRKTLLPLTALVLPLLAGGLALGLYTDGTWRFVGGMWFGCALTMGMWIRKMPPQYVENWATGAEGERKTARELRRLSAAGWTIRHDLPGRRGNIDHVAIGPAGIFLLDSKAPSGDIEVRGGRLVATRLGVDELTYGRSLGRAVEAAAHDLWIDLGGVRAGVPRVYGVAVVWGHLDEPTTADRFAVVPGRLVSGWLEAAPTTLSSADVERLAQRLEALTLERAARATA